MRSSDVAKPNQSDLEFLKALLEAGNLVSVIDRVYPLSETPEAIRYLEEGHARGKVVISVEQFNLTARRARLASPQDTRRIKPRLAKLPPEPGVNTPDC